MKGKRMTYRLTVCALMAALMCILGPLSIPVGAVPISLTTFVIYLAVFLLGAKGAAVSSLIYILLGAVGLPVFSNYTGGVQRLFSLTGGYIVGYILLALVAGFIMEKSHENIWMTVLGMIVGTALLYALGTAWFIWVSKSALGAALSTCVIPFIPFDLVKIAIATILGKSIRKALRKNNLL